MLQHGARGFNGRQRLVAVGVQQFMGRQFMRLWHLGSSVRRKAVRASGRRRVRQGGRDGPEIAEVPVASGRRVDQGARVFVARLGQHGFGGAGLDHLAALHDHDGVADLRGHAQVVRDEQHADAGALAYLLQQFQHLRLHRHVQRRYGFVGHQDLRVHDNRACDADALALATGQLHATLADVGVIATTTLPVHQRIDEGLGTCLGHGSTQLFLGRIRASVQQGVADRTMQQRGVLGDHADLLAKAFLGDMGDVLVVDQDAAAFQVVQAQQHVHQGRFAGAGRADQAELLARRHHQV
ncbi:hypothetical protein G6F62_012391 [Rhizopus arrhizus]|nr:hypothetical protein G6F62_012391 [Rhizopus arrhizus]